MSGYDHAGRAIVLHPWIAPRARAEVLLREATKRLAEKESKQRGKRQADKPRTWLGEGLVARRYGMAVDDRDVGHQASWDPTPAEDKLVARIVGAIEDEPTPGTV